MTIKLKVSKKQPPWNQFPILSLFYSTLICFTHASFVFVLSCPTVAHHFLFLAWHCISFTQVKKLTDTQGLKGINKSGTYKQISTINSKITYTATIYKWFLCDLITVRIIWRNISLIKKNCNAHTHTLSCMHRFNNEGCLNNHTEYRAKSNKFSNNCVRSSCFD